MEQQQHQVNQQHVKHVQHDIIVDDEQINKHVEKRNIVLRDQNQ